MADSKVMTFWDHLEDLRKGIFRVLAVLVGTSFALFFLKDVLFEKIIFAPSRPDFYLYQLLGTQPSLNFINIEVAAQFMIHMKVTFMCALILCFPYIIYEFWRFVAPGLYQNEKKAVGKALLFSSVLFYIGIAVSYFVIFPLMLNFFAGYQVSDIVPNTFSLKSYISLFMSMALTFGIVFEFPTIVAVLSALGIVTKKILGKLRRYAICAVLVLAAIITPSGDPFSLLVVSVPLYLLYEFSILICKDREVKAFEE